MTIGTDKFIQLPHLRKLNGLDSGNMAGSRGRDTTDKSLRCIANTIGFASAAVTRRGNKLNLQKLT